MLCIHVITSSVLHRALDVCILMVRILTACLMVSRSYCSIIMLAHIPVCSEQVCNLLSRCVGRPSVQPHATVPLAADI